MFGRQGATTGWIEWMERGGWLGVRTEHGASRGDMSTKSTVFFHRGCCQDRTPAVYATEKGGASCCVRCWWGNLAINAS